jgi:phosphoglycolate phosphatase
MAKEAGVKAVWARYGTSYDPELWNVLVRVTHWTRDDVLREARLKESAKGVQPDAIIDSFADILPIVRVKP